MTELTLDAFLFRHPRSILVEIASAKGSTPRAQGTFMLVADKASWGTIGGGALEYMAIDNARASLAGSGQSQLDIPLGPEIGQCCGGRTVLDFRPITELLKAELIARIRHDEEERPAVFLFGSGHVGLALARALQPLPFAVTVVESRADALAGLPDGVATRLTAMPEAAVTDIPAGGAAIVLTHDHALDFLIAERLLARRDLAYTGMIGSATKRATFAHWLARQQESAGEAGAMMARLILPVGGSMVKDKRPAVIAAMVAAELLQTYAKRQTATQLTDFAAGA